ncbi:hypothetical protein HYU40_04795 [Candidatus Woesearchaeota archaeon]|nr:hypothetical protein [Candidatus Woesearchaeota archaeon]
MTNKQLPYRFVHSNDTIGVLPKRNSGHFKEIFGERKFEGALESIVIEFELGQGLAKARDTAFGETSAFANSVWGMIIRYKAFGIVKFLWLQNKGLIAQYSEVLLPPDFMHVTMRPEELVEFAVKEAEHFAELYGLQVQLIYHGHPAYARKYLSKPQQQPQQK